MACRPRHLQQPLALALTWLLGACSTASAATPPEQATPAAAPWPATPLLAQLAPADVAPGPYLVSEKLDGVRALWDGQQLRFRSGRIVPAPDWFLAQLPRTTALDGELWLGRGRFDALSAIVRRATPIDAEWQGVRYMVFEMPHHGGSTFAQRAEHLKTLLASHPGSQVACVEHRRLADHAALQRWLAEVVAAGGEGLMLHHADAPTLSGRSPLLLKLKPLFDAEATVVGHRAGRGKYSGQTGALQVQTASGVTFDLGTGLSDALRRDPPAIGSTISFRYRHLTPSGKPRFASFWRVHDTF